MPAKKLPVSTVAAESGDRADDHHALDTEIEHAGFLHHQLADGGKDQGRGGDDDAQHDVDDQLHLARLTPPLAGTGLGAPPRGGTTQFRR